MPRGLDKGATRKTAFTISNLLPDILYRLSVQGEASGCELTGGTFDKSTDGTGVLRVTAPVGSQCMVTATKAPRKAPALDNRGVL